MSAAKIAAPPLDVQLRIVDAAAALQHLALRRQAWLESALLLDGRDPTALVDMGNAIDGQFAGVEETAGFLRACFLEYGPWIDERLAVALAGGRFGEAELAGFAKAVAVADGGYAERGVELATALAAGVPELRGRLRERIAGIPGGVALDFDAHGTACTLFALSTMGGLMMCPKTLGAGCAIGAGSMIALAAFC